MRKFLFVLLLILTITLTSCHSSAPPQIEDDSLSESVSETAIQDTVSDSESSSDTHSQSKIETSSIPQNDLEPVSTSKNTEGNLDKSTNSNVSSERTEEQPPIKTQPDDLTQDKPQPPPIESNAVSSDAKAIADKVIEYINQYRREQGAPSAVRLTGLTKYAEYRSRQLVSNFAHNTDDERAAATALKYGEYIDPALYGMNGKPYYTACAGEAIAKAGYTGTVDEVAKSLATLVKNSSEHWCYVGAPEYRYIGVGITYESGMWYCDIALTMENRG